MAVMTLSTAKSARFGGTRAEQGGNWNLANNVVIKTGESEFKGTKGDYFCGSFLILLILYFPHLRCFHILCKRFNVLSDKMNQTCSILVFIHFAIFTNKYLFSITFLK